MEGSLEGSSQSSWSGSVEVESRGDAAEGGRKPTPPPPPPQNAKPGRRDPPLLKPKPGTGMCLSVPQDKLKKVQTGDMTGVA